jgi:hypothetical protein
MMPIYHQNIQNNPMIQAAAVLPSRTLTIRLMLCKIAPKSNMSNPPGCGGSDLTCSPINRKHRQIIENSTKITVLIEMFVCIGPLRLFSSFLFLGFLWI